MSREPRIGHFLDEEEKTIVEAIEKEDYQAGKSSLTPERLQELQVAARETTNEERTRISLRLPKSDLARLKARAMQDGIPYQTLINSILHKVATK